MAAARCAACGRENRDSARYCRFCGRLIPRTAEPAVQAAQPVSPVSAVPAAPTALPAVSAAPAVPAASVEAAAAPVPEPMASGIPAYVGHEKIREELERIKKSIRFQRERRKAGAGGTAGPKIFVFRGDTGTGKTLAAAGFVEELRREQCLESDRITVIEARKLSRQYADEFALGSFLAENKPSALVVDDATESPSFIHELVLALSKSQEECFCIIVGSGEGFETFFESNAEDKQRLTGIFTFDPFPAEELALILMKQLSDKNYLFDPALRKHFESYIRERLSDPRCEYKNGWLVEKDIIPGIEKNQEARLTALDPSALKPEDYRTILEEDLPLKNKPMTIEEILAELDGMIGLAEVKKKIREIANTIKMQQELAEKGGAKGKGQAIHIVFTGNPGTGKTTVARKLGSLFKTMGLLPTDGMVETDRSGLVAGYVGQTAPLVNAMCDRAMGGILFIDEAYSLTAGGGGFGQEAIDALLKRMEDDRGKFVVIAAGYEKEMETFIQANPGLKSRFTHFLHLADYNPDELYAIFASMAKGNGYSLSPGAEEQARTAIEEIHRNRGRDFANGRTMRNLFDDTVRRMSGRLAAMTSEERTAAALSTITAEDIPYEKQEVKTVEEILTELDAMIGLAEVKKAVRNLAETIRMQKEREEKGLKGQGQAIHIVFTGNPGTGKTTVARKLGSLFKTMELLPSDKMIETDRSGMVGQYVGQTAPLVNEVCNKALGGILFIDEAYSLSAEGGGGFGQEAIDALLKRMEDDRGKFVVIAAGYEKEMETFIQANPGLKSRFTHFLHLADYNPDELYAIFLSMAKGNGYVLSPEAERAVKTAIETIHRNKGRDFANGRTMRNLFDDTVRKMGSRLAAVPAESRTAEALSTIVPEDIPAQKGGAA
jgi:SpoVK/Ycf46/Vps4 family AAA+-type ATPase